MTFDISKFLGPAAQPQGFLWLLLVLATLRCLLKVRIKLAVFLGGITAAMSLIGSTDLAARWLASLERPYVWQDLDKIPACDAVVMLGGTHNGSRYDAMGIELTESANRFLMAVELMRRGKGRVLVLGGSGISSNGRERPEAEVLQHWLAEWKPIQQPVENLGICSNTRDEAASLQRLASSRGWQRVLLVTSAYHMRRSVGVFQKHGVDVVPVGSDFTGLNHLDRRLPFTIFPRHYGFKHLRIYLHEIVGWHYYRIRGWIQ